MTVARLRPRRSGGASCAVTARTVGSATAAASAATTRSVISAAYELTSGTVKLARQKSVRAVVRMRRRGSRAVPTAAIGAATAQTTEKTVTSCPAAASLTVRPRARAGSTPVMTKSSVWRAKAHRVRAQSQGAGRCRRVVEVVDMPLA